jgi:hypothetical protein
MIEELLIAVLRAHANVRGLAMVREEVLLHELRTTPEVLAVTLRKLEQAGLIEILTPKRFFVIRIRKWPGKEAEPPRIAMKTGAPASHAYSYKRLLNNRLNNSYRQAAPAAMPEKDLLQEILETLGETNAASFEKAVELYSPKIIRTALDRVRRAQGIRTSRTALFRHLLPRLARESRNAA